MMHALSICYTGNTLSDGEEIYEVVFISDNCPDKDDVQVNSLIKLSGLPLEDPDAEYIFAQTVERLVHRPFIQSKTLSGFTIEIPGYQEERVVVKGPLVKNKVEALARGFFGRIDAKH